jgi:benzoate/toluate 1,2-dioxygenase reductase subunit
VRPAADGQRGFGALRERGINPAGFWYEKFLASQSAAA